MKKVLQVLMICLLVSSMFISCSLETSLSQGVYLLDFKESSKGMTYFPTGNPFGSMNGDTADNNFWFQCMGMSTMPIIPSLTKVNGSPKNILSSLKDKEVVYGYSFPMEIDTEVSTANGDGIFIRYIIKEGTKDVGMIDYYYSIADKTFSYREIVLPLFKQYGGDNILIFELYDVPVSEDKDGVHFKADYKDNGFKFMKISIGEVGQELKGKIRFNYHDMSMIFDGGKIVSCGMKKNSFGDANNNPGEHVLSFTTINPALETFAADTTNQTTYGFTYTSGTSFVASEAGFNLASVYKFLSYICDAGTIEALEKAEDVTSLEKFKALHFSYDDNLLKNTAVQVDEYKEMFAPIMCKLSEDGNVGATVALESESASEPGHNRVADRPYTFDEIIAQFKTSTYTSALFTNCTDLVSFTTIILNQLGYSSSFITEFTTNFPN